MHIGLITRCEVPYTLDLANQLHDAGVQVSLYMCYDHTALEVGSPDQPELRLFELKLLPWDIKVHLVRLPRMSDLGSITVFWHLSRQIIADGVDVAHLLVGSDDLWFAFLPLLLRKIPVTSTMTQPTRDIGERFPFLIIWAIQKLLTIGSGTLIVNGVDQPKLVERHYGVKPDRVFFIPLSVRTSALRWASSVVAAESRTILFFGRAAPHKGLDYLIKAQPFITDKVPDARFLIAAHGKDLERCKRLIQDPTCFEIHDEMVPGDEMATFFQRCSLVALPYLDSTSSGVLMTAYTFGKPVVASNVTGLAEYVQDGATGVLVPPADEQKLAAAIVRLLSDATLIDRMGESARQWVAGWQEDVTQKTLLAYEKAATLHSRFAKL